MDDERRAKIEDALRRYRETVTQHNLSLLRALVEAVEALPPPPNCSETTAQGLRLRELDDELGFSVSELVESPRDLLSDDIRDEVVIRAGLDGLGRTEIDLEGREAYFAAVRARIAELNVEVAEFPPTDLAYLCTLVDGITGPGWGVHHLSQQIEFISSPREGLEEHVGVPVPNEEFDQDAWPQLFGVWEDWEIAVAVKIGQAPFPGGCYALYCRNNDNQQWKWRYGLNDGDWCSDIYGSVEDFLVNYAHFREQTEEEVRSDVEGAGLMI